jgi:hypothetical protein
MIGPIIKRHDGADALAMANRFGRYKPEEEKAVRKVEVVEDETLKQLKAAWKAFYYQHIAHTGIILNSRDDEACYGYPRALEIVKRLDYSVSDIENFSIALAEFQGEEYFGRKAGTFLSALMNHCNDKEFVIHTAHLANEIDSLGYKNTKNITVKGNAGLGVGHHMLGGSITVEGNVDDNAGDSIGDGHITIKGSAGSSVGNSMSGGSILVEGDVGANCGNRMADGTITVNGDAGRSIGEDMEGGEIRIGGDIEGISKLMRHGKIFQKGELIFEK